MEQKDQLRKVLVDLEDVFSEAEDYTYDIKDELDPDSELLIIKKDFSLNKTVAKLEKFDYYSSLEEAIEELENYCEHAESIIEELEEFFQTSRAKKIP